MLTAAKDCTEKQTTDIVQVLLVQVCSFFFFFPWAIQVCSLESD